MGLRLLSSNPLVRITFIGGLASPAFRDADHRFPISPITPYWPDPFNRCIMHHIQYSTHSVLLLVLVLGSWVETGRSKLSVGLDWLE